LETIKSMEPFLSGSFAASAITAAALAMPCARRLLDARSTAARHGSTPTANAVAPSRGASSSSGKPVPLARSSTRMPRQSGTCSSRSWPKGADQSGSSS
jgi:hypothetical protein